MAEIPNDPENAWANGRSKPGSALSTLTLFTTNCGKSPKELLDMQEKCMTATKVDEQYIVLDLVEKWINSIKGRRGTKLNYLSTVRSFFEYYRRTLPATDKNWLHKIRSERGQAQGKVSPDALQSIVRSLQGDPRRLSMILVQLQTFSGPRELCIIGNTMGVEIGKQIKDGANLIELYFPTGRKHSDKSWHTYIGKEGCEALRRWFEIRGYPTKDAPYVWPSIRPQSRGGPLTEIGLAYIFTRITARLGMRPKLGSGELTDRYGVSVKELRDLAISLAQQARGKENELGEAFQESSAEYFAGHTIDDLGYRKIHDLDPEYRKRQYQLVEPYLSPFSGNHVHGRLEAISTENEQLRAKLETVEARTAALDYLAKAFMSTPGLRIPISRIVREYGLNDEQAKELERLFRPTTKDKTSD